LRIVQLDELMGKPFVLFKDKCNVKNPGGGAFPPHQDIAAYYHFTPKFHVTAAVMLDASTIENGCVEMALDYQKYTSLASQIMHGPFGGYPFFDFYPSGPRNGDIVDEVSAVFDWQPMQAEPGDIVLFNSFVPHRSAKNTSDKRRRNFFFTYNALEEGDWYQTYYQTKQQHFDNKMFHVSTPTQHGSML
jgi:ectoine hydroxylase-related dioxygenase (phytanoyl-CoA dioxygenase family)